MKPQNDEPRAQFDWIGLAMLVIGIDIPLRLLADPRTTENLLIVSFLVCGLILTGFVRRYDWKNAVTALLLILTLHPVRFLFRWWMNPVVYGLATVVCLLVLTGFVRRYDWKNHVATLLLVWTLLSGWQMLVSASEVGQCYIDDIRWTYYFYCKSSGGQYQQIESLPIGMQDYCYYCPWY